MSIVDQVPPKTKTAAVTAASGFFLANPLISAFLIGAGVAIYFAIRSRRSSRA
jgi:hypothetical protein